MLVEFLCDRAGPCGIQHEGEAHDLPEAEALRLVAAGQARPAKPAAPQTAMARPPENAALPRPKPRRLT